MNIKKLISSLIIAVFAMVILVGVVSSGSNTPNNAGSLGKTTVDAEVGWTVGSGQFDGEFITAETQGVVIGLRAQERFVGTIDVIADQGGRVGVYEASIGVSDTSNRAK